MRTAASINEHQHLSLYTVASHTYTPRLNDILQYFFFFQNHSNFEFYEDYRMKWIDKPTNHTNIITFIVRCYFVYVDILLLFFFFWWGIFTLCKLSKWMWILFLILFLSLYALVDIVPSHLLFVLSLELSVGRAFFLHIFHSENCTQLSLSVRVVYVGVWMLCNFLFVSSNSFDISTIQYYSHIFNCHAISFSFEPKINSYAKKQNIVAKFPFQCYFKCLK